MEGALAAGIDCTLLVATEQLESLVLIDRFYFTAESQYGIKLPLDVLIDHIKKVVVCSKDDIGKTLALAFDGRFTSRIPVDTIWMNHLQIDINSVNKHQMSIVSEKILRMEAISSTTVFTSSTAATGSGHGLLSLPAGIIRYIIHLGAESLLPASRSPLKERRFLHLRRSHYLTHAALVHSIFRREAQLELVSFAYSHKGSTLTQMLGFVEQNDLGLDALRLDHFEGTGLEDRRNVWRESLVRLSRSKAALTLNFLDLGGEFGLGVIRSFSQRELSSFLHLRGIRHSDNLREFEVPQLSSIQFSCLPKVLPNHTIQLPASATTLSLDSCHVDNLSHAFSVSPNVLQIKVTGDPDRMTTRKVRPIPGQLSHNTLFPNAKKLVLANIPQSHELLMSMDFPSVTRVEMLLIPLYGGLIPKWEYSMHVWMSKRLLTFPRLESLLLPKEYRNMGSEGSEDNGETVSAEDFIQRGVTVEFT